MLYSSVVIPKYFLSVINGVADKNPLWLNSGSAILSVFLTGHKFAIVLSFGLFLSDETYIIRYYLSARCLFVGHQLWVFWPQTPWDTSLQMTSLGGNCCLSRTYSSEKYVSLQVKDWETVTPVWLFLKVWDECHRSSKHDCEGSFVSDPNSFFFFPPFRRSWRLRGRLRTFRGPPRCCVLPKRPFRLLSRGYWKMTSVSLTLPGKRCSTTLLRG